jgi:hypothetical protein
MNAGSKLAAPLRPRSGEGRQAEIAAFVDRALEIRRATSPRRPVPEVSRPSRHGRVLSWLLGFLRGVA